MLAPQLLSFVPCILLCLPPDCVYYKLPLASKNPGRNNTNGYFKRYLMACDGEQLYQGLIQVVILPKRKRRLEMERQMVSMRLQG